MSVEELMSKVLGDSFTHYVGKDSQMIHRTEYHIQKAAPKKIKKVQPLALQQEIQKKFEELKRKHYAAGQYSFQRVLDVFCAVYGVTEEEILSPCRRNLLVLIRRQIVVILKDKRNLSYLEIGRRLNRDHSTIIHAYTSALGNPKVLNNDYEEILSRLENYGG